MVKLEERLDTTWYYVLKKGKEIYLEWNEIYFESQKSFKKKANGIESTLGWFQTGQFPRMASAVAFIGG
jgi:hypothetical protein